MRLNIKNSARLAQGVSPVARLALLAGIGLSLATASTAQVYRTDLIVNAPVDFDPAPVADLLGQLESLVGSI